MRSTFYLHWQIIAVPRTKDILSLCYNSITTWHNGIIFCYNEMSSTKRISRQWSLLLLSGHMFSSNCCHVWMPRRILYGRSKMMIQIISTLGSVDIQLDGHRYLLQKIFFWSHFIVAVLRYFVPFQRNPAPIYPKLKTYLLIYIWVLCKRSRAQKNACA